MINEVRYSGHIKTEWKTIVTTNMSDLENRVKVSGV